MGPCDFEYAEVEICNAEVEVVNGAFWWITVLTSFNLNLICSYQNPIVNGQHTNSTADDVKIMNQRSHILYEQLKGFVQRMDMNVVKKDLPPKTVVVIAVKLSPLQRKLYKRFLDVHGFTKGKVSAEKTRKSFFAGYQALAQVYCWSLLISGTNVFNTNLTVIIPLFRKFVDGYGNMFRGPSCKTISFFDQKTYFFFCF